ncbi:MAG TPA: hypothetical protein VKE72_06330, partial [Methylocella sp.]|nr:hypothetical protein [Methylocella sp.]
MITLHRRSSKHSLATHLTAGIAAILLSSTAMTPTAALADRKTQTPIKHLIVLIGENWSFDSVFATYRPKQGQTIANLLSKGIILKTGAPGPNFIKSQQFQVNPPFPATYFIDASTLSKTVYQQSPLTPTFPVP